MSKKILVFESDAGFAQELKSGFDRLGCETSVVDDANQGLQAAARDKPDLILLSIELPRMNGFSVCNKLKRDAALKDVPLIIMSADSTEETFEQHRRLRTRAEDYVKKPIAFDELLARIQPFVALGGGGSSQVPESTGDEAIVLDDDIEIEDAEVSASPSEAPEISTRQSLAEADVNDFAEQAFGNLVEGPPPSDVGVEIAEAEVMSSRAAHSAPPPQESTDSESIEIADAEVSEEIAAVSLSDLEPASAAPPTISSNPPARAPSVRPSVRPASVAPRAADVGDVAKHREEIERQRARIQALEEEAREASAKVSELEDAVKRGASKDSEVQRLQRELDETKAKLSAASSGGGKGAGSAREFLDLREQLNKKDKEILEIRDQLSHKEKDLLALRDGSLALEREKADLSDTISELEKGAAELVKAADAAKSDKEQASKRADDFKRKGEKLKADLDAKVEELAAALSAHESALAERDAQASAAANEHEARLAAAASEHEQRLTAAAEAHAAALRAAQEQAAREQEAAVARTRAEVEAERDRALAAAESAASAARESAVATREAELNRSHQEALGSLRAELEQELEQAQSAAGKRLAEREAELNRQLEAQGEKLKSTSEALAAREQTIRELRSDLEGKIEELEVLKKTSGEQATRNTALEALLSATKGSLDIAQQDLSKDRAALERARSKWNDDRASLERAKDALAAALSQIEEAEGRTLE